MSPDNRTRDASLSAGFRHETLEKTVRDTRLTTVVASIAFALFNILDYFVYPDFYRPLLGIRLGVIAANSAIHALMHARFARKYSREFAMIEYLVCGLAIVWMVHLTEGYLSPYYAGINLVLLGFIFILPIDARRTLIICLILYAAYIGPIAASLAASAEAPDLAILLNNNFFLLATILLVIISAHLATQIRLKEYSGRFNLARANKELKQLDLLKSQFFANVSHEVRTPLTSILGPIQSLHLGDLGPLQPDQQRLIEQAFRNSLRLLDLINQMLDFSRLEAGKMRLHLALIKLDELAQDLVALFEEVAARKGLALRFESVEDVPAAYLDSGRVERILTNLIRNAIKFTESGFIAVRVDREPGRLVLEVEDTGIGIPAAHLPRIFQRFQQVDGSSTRKYEGTGLGLTIVKESVDLMRGTVSVDSREGQGSRFRVELPDDLERLEPTAFIERRTYERRREERQFPGEDQRKRIRRRDDLARITLEDLVLIDQKPLPGREPPAVEKPPAPDAIRVLLVEDNADLSSYVGRMLRAFGHRVAIAPDGLAGWEHLQQEPVDLIVSDLMMPRMDGYELLRRIKEEKRLRHLPVILITAEPAIEMRIRGLETGADDYLAKPINVRELDARIRNLVTQRRFQRALALADELDTRMHELSLSFAQSLEMRDSHTAGHSRDVLNLGLLIAEELGLPADRLLKESLLLHDIGKLGIPDRILWKESALDRQEWELMKRHPILGAELLGRFPSFQEISAVVRAHQEHYDGTGYPDGLRGEQIPLAARIVAVADAFQAMTSDRPYRRALTTQEALAELLRHRGTQFDPRVVDAFARGLVRVGLVEDGLPQGR